MSVLKTLATALLASVTLGCAVHAQALPRSVEARLTLFAQCAGRFSAEVEHDWLLGGDGAAAARDRAWMVGLIDALLPVSDIPGRSVLAMRIEAKMAHAALLTRAEFSGNARARRLAQRHVARCAALLPAPREVAALR